MVSVVIPACNAEQSADALVKPLIEQATRPEIAVVDPSSADRAVRTAKYCHAVVLRIRRDDCNHRGTGNFGMEQGAGEIVVFLTQDAVPCDPDRIGNLTQAQGDAIKAASYGRQLSGEEATPTEKLMRHVNHPDRPLLKRWDDIPQLAASKRIFQQRVLCITEKTFKKLGGFPEKLIMFENMFFAVRLLQDGYKIGCVPGGTVMHSHNCSWPQKFRWHAMAGISLLKAPNQRTSVYLFERTKADQARVLGDSLNREGYSGHAIVPVFSASTVWHEYC